jgi:peptidoglycan/LPS O-acetylase OafA/YrhL
MVVAFHAGLPIPGGFVGVDVFFVISGYVITAMLHREWTTTGRILFFTFYLRRFKRLTPALAVVVVATVILSYLLLSPFGTQQITAKTALGAMLLGANVIIARTTGDYFDAPAELNPLLNTWSLSVEEQFYIVFPTILFIGWHLARRVPHPKATPFLIVGSIAAVSFGLAVFGSTGYVLSKASWLVGFYSPFTRAWEFAVGAILALAMTRHILISENLTLVFGLLGAGMLTASLGLISSSTPFPGVWTLLPVTGSLLLLFAGTNNSNLVTRALATRSMVKIGDWSYSIYLWHWPLIVFAGVLWPNLSWIQLFAAILSIGPAIASYKWVEQPIRDMPITKRRRVAMVAITTVFPALGLASVAWAAPRLGLLPTDIKAAIETVSKPHVPSERGCMTKGPFTPESVVNCGWNLTANGSPIYLAGDSDAWHFAEATIGAAELLDRPVWIFTTPSCPLISNLTISWIGQSEFFPSAVNPNEFNHCDSYVTYTLAWLQQAPPGTVFIAALDQYWWDPSIRVKLEGADATTRTEEKAVVLRKGLAATVKTLQSSGHHVSTSTELTVESH